MSADKIRRLDKNIFKELAKDGEMYEKKQCTKESLLREQILDIAREYWKSAALFAAIDLRVFEDIERHGIPSDVNIRCYKKFMNILKQMDLIRQLDSHKFENTEKTRLFLLKDSETSILNMIAHYKNIMPAVNSSRISIRTGIQVAECPDYNVLLKGLSEDKKGIYLPPIFANAKVLDVGGGDGTIGMMYNKMCPDSEITIVEKGNNFVKLVDNLKAHDIEDSSIVPISGDFTEPIGELNNKEFDYIIIFELLHCKKPQDRIKIMQNAVKLLSKKENNGKIIIREQLGDDSLKNSLFNLNMWTLSEGGEALDFIDIKKLADTAKLEITDMITTPRFSYIILEVK